MCISYPVIKFDQNPTIESINDPSRFCQGLLRNAAEMYGPLLENFIVHYHSNDGVTECVDFYGGRKGVYQSKRANKVVQATIYFREHDFYITGYQIQPNDSPKMTGWVIVGCKSPDDKGVILDHRTNQSMPKTDSFYSYEITENNDQPFRLIRIIGCNGFLCFKSFDFYGTAKPGKRNPFTDAQLLSSYYYPDGVSEMYVGWLLIII